jgi:hypothetical protein
MSTSALLLHDNADSHRVLITHRDWGLLWGPHFNEGPLFSSAFGVYENFSVARGIQPGSRVTRTGASLYVAAEALLLGINRDADLLRFDYSFGFSGDSARRSGAQSIHVHGKSGTISTRPNGYCYIRFQPPSESGPLRSEDFIDLRRIPKVQTDAGIEVKVYRRKASIAWPESLPPLLAFLQTRLERGLFVEHQERAQ